MVDNPTLSVIIPHYQDLASLERCLDALDRQTMSKIEFEVIVSDNASPCGLAAVEAVVRRRANIVVQAEKGAGPTRNAGVAASRGRMLAFIDSDCVAEPGWASAGAAALSRFDIVGGHVAVLIPLGRAMTPTEAFEAVFAFDFKTYVEKKGFAGAGNLFCARSTFDAVGPFRAGMSEDVEWCHRARDVGYSIGYVPDAQVGHPARATWVDMVAKWKRVQSETYKLRRPTLLNKLRWLARAWAMPISIVAHAPKIWRSSSLSSNADRFRALQCLARIRLWRMANAHLIAFGLRR